MNMLTVRRYASLMGIILSPVPGVKLILGLILLGLICSGIIYWQGFQNVATGMIVGLFLAWGFFVLIWLPMSVSFLVSLNSARSVRLLGNFKLRSGFLLLAFAVIAALLSGLGITIFKPHMGGYWANFLFVLALYSLCCVVSLLCMLRWPSLASLVAAPAVWVFGGYLEGGVQYLSAFYWPLFLVVIAATWIYLIVFYLRFSPRQQIRLAYLKPVRSLNIPVPVEFPRGLRPTSFLLSGSDRIRVQILLMAIWLAGLLGFTWLTLKNSAGINAATGVGLFVMHGCALTMIFVYSTRFARVVLNTRFVWLLAATGREGLLNAIEKSALRDSLAAVIVLPLYWGILNLMSIGAPALEEIVRLVAFCSVMFALALYCEIWLYTCQLNDWEQNFTRLIFYLLVTSGVIIFYTTMQQQLAQWIALFIAAALASGLRLLVKRGWQRVSFVRGGV